MLSHKDMCLVFCAFASWAVKTSDLQAPDAWKTGMCSARLERGGKGSGREINPGYLYLRLPRGESSLSLLLQFVPLCFVSPLIPISARFRACDKVAGAELCPQPFLLHPAPGREQFVRIP